jgi:hypothetical protein
MLPFESNLLFFFNINNIFYKFINYYINYNQNNNTPGARVCTHHAVLQSQARGPTDPLSWVCSQCRGLTLASRADRQPQRQVFAAPPYPTKTCTDCFLSNHHFNVKCLPIKRQPHTPPVIFATLCDKSNFVITLL